MPNHSRTESVQNDQNSLFWMESLIPKNHIKSASYVQLKRNDLSPMITWAIDDTQLPATCSTPYSFRVIPDCDYFITIHRELQHFCLLSFLEKSILVILVIYLLIYLFIWTSKLSKKFTNKDSNNNKCFRLLQLLSFMAILYHQTISIIGSKNDRESDNKTKRNWNFVKRF